MIWMLQRAARPSGRAPTWMGWTPLPSTRAGVSTMASSMRLETWPSLGRFAWSSRWRLFVTMPAMMGIALSPESLPLTSRGSSPSMSLLVLSQFSSPLLSMRSIQLNPRSLSGQAFQA